MIAKRINKTYRVPLLYDGSGGSLLPPELQACEYIKGDGNSYILLNNINVNDINYINTKLIGNNVNKNIFGCRYGNNSSSFQLYVNNQNPAKYSFRYFNTGGASTDSNVGLGDILELEINDNIGVFNGTTYNLNKGNYLINYYLCLFGVNSNNSIIADDATIYFFETNLCNLFSSYIIDGQEFTDNKGVICQAGTPGMYDVANHIFYTNDGTGNFSHGPDIII